MLTQKSEKLREFSFFLCCEIITKVKVARSIQNTPINHFLMDFIPKLSHKTSCCCCCLSYFWNIFPFAQMTVISWHEWTRCCKYVPIKCDINFAGEKLSNKGASWKLKAAEQEENQFIVVTTSLLVHHCDCMSDGSTLNVLWSFFFPPEWCFDETGSV